MPRSRATLTGLDGAPSWRDETRGSCQPPTKRLRRCDACYKWRWPVGARRITSRTACLLQRRRPTAQCQCPSRDGHPTLPALAAAGSVRSIRGRCERPFEHRPLMERLVQRQTSGALTVSTVGLRGQVAGAPTRSVFRGASGHRGNCPRTHHTCVMGFVEWTPGDATDGRSQGVQDLLDRLPKGDGQAPQDRNFPELAPVRGCRGRASTEATALVETYR